MPTQTPRAKSKELLKTKEYPATPIIDPGWSHEEREAALEAIKPLHYARLAEVIDLVFTDMKKKKANNPPTGFVKAKYTPDNPTPWQQLRSDSIASVHESIKAVDSSPQFRETAAINRFIGTLDPNRFINLEMQLIAGMDTAASSMLTILQNIPDIIAHHDSEYIGQEAAIARNSIVLPMRLAMTCVDRMMAAQTALAGNEQHKSWANFDRELISNHFKLQPQKDGLPRLTYENFSGLIIPKGYEKGPDHKPIARATKIGELACYQATIIGCPFTLLAGRMEELWNWYIDVVESQALWVK